MAIEIGHDKQDFGSVYNAHAPFVWRSLRRLGVPESDIEDTCQEAFLVVHKKLPDFQGANLRPWLFAIAMRVAADYRKRAHVRREVVTDKVTEVDLSMEGQAEALDRARALRLLEALLASLEEDKRAVFILHELEGMSVPHIAEALHCPAQTAYSRLKAARKQVNASIQRWKLGERKSA